ncbi:hypothetical protein KV205_26585 [Streptomyces sp. SKN60]|uniref:hypothetical protein n=1 Tax=Streptomyces sp. SKN60 TaxID=2855506 RepID=UPI002246CE6C|nr:hypothetical protein [Streptomyces sp. SKN60]MCX2184074.1 hypothetical protein [Streptomyces sp. SKN60]
MGGDSVERGRPLLGAALARDEQVGQGMYLAGHLGAGVGELVAQSVLVLVEAVGVAGEQTGDLAG